MLLGVQPCFCQAHWPRSLLSSCSRCGEIDRHPSSCGQEVGGELVESSSVLNLGPMAAMAEHMQFGVREEVKETATDVGWDHPVLSPVHDQGWMSQRCKCSFVRCQCVDVSLTRGRKHSGEALLKSGLHAGSVAQFGELIGDEFSVKRKDVEQIAHGGDGWFITPHGIQTRSDRELHAHTPHQHQPAHSVRESDGECESHSPTKAVAHNVSLLDVHRIEKMNEMADP